MRSCWAFVRAPGNREAKARKGNAPGRMKPRKARVPHVEKSGDGQPEPGRGMKPLKRGRVGRDAYAPKAPEHHSSERDSLKQVVRRARPLDGQSRRCEEKAGLVFAEAVGSQSQEGMRRREAVAIFAGESFEGPSPVGASG